MIYVRGYGMRKILFAFFGILLSFCANGAQIANVEYVHLMLKQHYGIEVPYNPALKDVHAAANMKYLLTAVDIANQMLNGQKITDYGNSEYATTRAADTVAVDTMVRDYVRDYKFFATTTPDTESFSFSISASGVFFIDWGDGKRESFNKTNTNATTYSHDYATAGEYTIKIGGHRTGGNSISFQNNLNLAKIDGSLGQIFCTIKTSTGAINNPSFKGVFQGCANLGGTIPSDLFSGLYGQPVPGMFYLLFANCSGLTGEIPLRLFADVSGKPTTNLFQNTFKGCSGLTGEIPAGLFAGIHGSAVYCTFNGTFQGCSGLGGAIPENLFGGISGSPGNSMFAHTFSGCRGLTSIPDNLFGDISGEAIQWMFTNTFYGCSGLTGESAKINGKYLYEIWPDATSGQVGGMYYNAKQLTDYADIPATWK